MCQLSGRVYMYIGVVVFVALGSQFRSYVQCRCNGWMDGHLLGIERNGPLHHVCMVLHEGIMPEA